MRRGWPSYTRSHTRSLLPLLAAGTLVIGFVGGGLLLTAETAAMAALDRQAIVGITHERAHAGLEAYRAWLREHMPSPPTPDMTR